MSRRSFIVMTSAAAALRALPATAQAPATVRIGTGPVEEFALPYYAVQNGFFRAAGLDVDFQLLSGGGNITQAVVTGALDVAVTNSGSLSSAHLRGLPISLIAPGGLYSQREPIAHFIVAKSSPIRSARELAGKTIGVTTLRDMIQAAAMAWIDKHGGDARNAQWYEILSSEMGPALAAGRLDAAAIVQPPFSAIEADVTDIGRPYESVNDGRPFQTTGAIANTAWAQRNPALLRRVVQVLLQTAAWANANPDEVAVLLAQLTKLTPQRIASFPRVTYATQNDPGFIQPVVDVIARYGFIPHAFPASELFVRA